MSKISLDNGLKFWDIDDIYANKIKVIDLWEQIEIVMDKDLCDHINYFYDCNTCIEYLCKYLQLSKHDLIIG